MPKPTDEILDWVVSDTPFTEEAELPPDAPSAPQSSAPRSGVFTFPIPKWAAPRRVALTLALTAVIVLLAVWLGTAWSEGQLKQEIQMLVATENFEAGDFALPMPLLEVPPASGVLQTLTRLSPTLLRAEVKRTFIDNVTRREVNFLQTQFYARTEAGWVQTAPPADFWGLEVLEHTLTQRLTLRYPAVDADFVQTLTPTLEKVLASACAEWQCPPLEFTVQWVTGQADVDAFSVHFSGFTPNLYGSRTLGLSTMFLWAGADNAQITLPSPHAAGLPADAASKEFYTETISLLILQQLAFNLSRNPQTPDIDDYENPFRIALLARLAARLGLDNARTPELLNPNPHQWDSSLWRNGYLDANTLRSALVITNRLLHTQTITTETKLLKALATADGVLSWMMDGLNLTTKEAVALSDQVNEEPWPIENLAANPGEILLECSDGIQMWRGTQTEPEPLLTGYFPESTVGQFSPDGQKLIAYISRQMAVIDFSKGTVIWLPNGHSATEAQWLDDETLVYRLWGNAIGVRIYQLYVGEVVAFDSDIISYQLSPDRTQALIVRDDGRVSLIPARGGEETVMSVGEWPQWSSGGEAITFMEQTYLGARLRLVHLQRDTARVLVDTQNLGGENADFPNQFIFHQWSPNGEWLAFNLLMFDTAENNPNYHHWVGVVRRDGENLRVLAKNVVSPSLVPFGAEAFSADGRYFALVKVGEGVLIHNLARNTTRLISVPGLQNIAAQWSPTGYEVLISTTQGVRRVLDARQTNPRLISLSGPECYRAVWVP